MAGNGKDGGGAIGQLIKWGIIAIVAFFAFRWISRTLSGGVTAAADASLYAGYPYAAPLPGATATYGWAAPWQYGMGSGRRVYGRHGRH